MKVDGEGASRCVAKKRKKTRLSRRRPGSGAGGALWGSAVWVSVPFTQGGGGPSREPLSTLGSGQGPFLHLAGSSAPNEEIHIFGVCGREFLDHRRLTNFDLGLDFFFFLARESLGRNAPGAVPSDVTHPTSPGPLSREACSPARAGPLLSETLARSRVPLHMVFSRTFFFLI